MSKGPYSLPGKMRRNVQKRPEELDYLLLETVTSTADANGILNSQNMTFQRRTADETRVVYRCSRRRLCRCRFDMMVEKEMTAEGNEIFHVYTRGVHNKACSSQQQMSGVVQGRDCPEEYFFICDLENREDLERTRRGYRKLARSSRKHGYFLCRIEGCPNELCFTYIRNREGLVKKALFSMKGMHNHEL